MTARQDAYFEALGTYFGGEVDLLDSLDAQNPIHRYIRRESLTTLERSFAPPGPLLEIGYGTGFEAVHLAKRGFRVVGVDPSAQMQARARARAGAEGVSVGCDFRLGSTASLASLLEEFGVGAFRGAYSTLGPFNCEPDLPATARLLGRLLAPGSPLVALMINRYCVWETALYLAAGDFRRAFRRQVRGWGDLTGEIGGSPIPVFTYTPASFAKAFESHFAVKELFALPFALPPPYVADRFRRAGGLLALLEAADVRLRRRAVLRGLGDHFEVVLRSNP